MSKQLFMIETTETIRRLYCIKADTPQQAEEHLKEAGEFVRSSQGEYKVWNNQIEEWAFTDRFRQEQKMGNIASGWGWDYTDEQALAFIEEV